ncbi:serine/threonine-protein kinase Nek4 isoform X5 [Ictidomys tridecemlineatus]|uniref:serine/threonine-protein kinase Nek4 isoform X4 n=1 Tax=Ictidomys tridecemlineatus TaxID=43179 RepID=UPI000B53B236|nr:serine/threonine-protein kinase Nek4 isoform X4 [Ictidomys tridecemlineatus]KAG3279329.1 NIMA related kinase 4, transcript variant X3 [Ictidomys tridecemlineatus]
MPLAAYCYVRVVGKGSYGEVTLVKHRRDGRQYVIKKLNLRNASSRERRAAEQEAQLLSQLKHPNIVTYKESWEGGDGLLYIVMGFCEGGDLYRKLKEQKGQLLPESQVVEWFVQIAMALQLPPMPRVYSPELAELIRTMLSKRPEERPSVRSILRQPYIKRQISVFLEATKAKTSKNNIKNGDSKSKPVATVVSRKAGSNLEAIHHQQYSAEDSKTNIMSEDKCLSQEKPIVIGPLKPPASLKGHTDKLDMSSTAESQATISRVNIDILPAERRDSMNDGLIQKNQQRHLDASSEHKDKCSISQVKEESLQDNSKSSAHPESLILTLSSDSGSADRSGAVKLLQPLNKDPKPKDHDQVDSECIMEKQGTIHPGLQPHSSGSEPSLSRQRRQKKREQTEHSGGKSQFQQVPPQLLPSHPSVGEVAIISTQQNAENPSRMVTESVSSSRSSEMSSSKVCGNSQQQTHMEKKKDRPLSARERRRLKQSQEEMFPSGPSVRTSLSAVGPGKLQQESQHIPARRFSSDCSITQERKMIHCLSEDELSSSTSSTDKSDGDSREGKSHTNEMSDLVQLMTETLKLDSKESCEDLALPNPVSEFKLHRKYRDTLVLHGKVAQETEELQFKELPSAIMPGSEKIRRIVEVLRADVIRGLGVQLLEQVYDLLEEENELEREVRLQEHMGEKYTTYSVKARQLKFFEENVKF